MNLSFTKERYCLQILLIGFALLTGCAHVRSTSDNSDQDVPAPKNLTEVLQQDINYPTETGDAKSIVVEDDGEIIVRGIKLKNTKFDIPISINSRVEFWVDYFTGRGRGFFEKYLERSEFFVPYIVPLLKQSKMPEDLVYLAMIESGFNNLARSRARAVGPWQFMGATGKRYGLRVDWWVDERRDIRKSTLAAVQYLKDLYTMFQSWELAAAAYNAGEFKVLRAIRRFGSKDFWVIARHRFLKHETRDYVPKIIAAALIAKNRAQFGFSEKNTLPPAGVAIAADGGVVELVKTDKPLEDSEYKKEKEIDTQMASDDNEDDAPTVSEIAPSLANQMEIAPAPLAKPVPTPHVTKKGEVGGEELADFDVQSPADLLKIARAAGLSYTTVKNLNPEILRWCTPPTAGSYRVKLPASSRERFLATYNHEAFPRKVQFLTYKVHRGETLSRIARHFGIHVDPMRDLNRISVKMPLRRGEKVLLPMPSDRSRTFASLEVRDPPEKRRNHHHRRRGSRYFKITYKNRSSARSVGSQASLVDVES